MTKGSKVVVHMVFEKETPGAVRYQEVDANGNPLKGDTDGALLSTQYLRKLALSKHMGSTIPQKLTIEISVG